MSDPMEDIKRQYRKVVCAALLTAACVIFGLFMIFFNPVMGIALIIAGIIVCIALYRPCRKSYDDLVNRINIERTTCRLIDSPAPASVGGDIFTCDMLMASDFVPEPAADTSPLFCWELKGNRKGFKIALSDTTILQRYGNGSGKNVYYTLSGVFGIFDLPADTGRYFIVMDRAFMPDTLRELHMNTMSWYVREEMGDRDLDSRFFLYRSCKDLKIPIPAAFLQSLKRLMNYTPGQAAITVKGSVMYAFINARFLSRKVPVTKQVTPEELDKDQFPELSYLINTASTLTGGSEKQGRLRIEDEAADEEEKGEKA